MPECSINTTDSFYDVLLWASSATALRGIQCQLREVEGCAHMLLGNDSFCVPTQPADRQRDTIAALRVTMRPHIQALVCLAQLRIRPWHTGQELDEQTGTLNLTFSRRVEASCLLTVFKMNFFLYNFYKFSVILNIAPVARTTQCIYCICQICWGLCFDGVVRHM